MNKSKLSGSYRIFVLVLLLLLLLFSANLSFNATDFMDWFSFSLILPLESRICLFVLLITYPVYRILRARLAD